jgi:hypothetical protein
MNTYTPPIPQTPPPTYELKKEVTGQGPVKRGPQVIKDTFGNERPVPFPPKAKCKRCYGRGYIGKDVVSGGLVLCKKCYPML